MQVTTFQCPHCHEEVWVKTSIMTTKNDNTTGAKNHCKSCQRAILRIRAIEWERDDKMKIDTCEGVRTLWTVPE